MESLLHPLLNLLLLPLAISAVLRPSAADAISYPKEALPTKSGYLKVNSTTGSSIFYTFYEAQNPQNKTSISQTPILIWLQGGPGCSSMLANFYELGPWLVSQDLSLRPNPGSWNRIFGLLFLDNPIGTGFSIAASPQEIPRNQHDVARHLFTAIREFLALDASFRSRPVYITGESYAGKYLPALGHYILKKNAVSPCAKRVNLGGVAIGNGLTDPEVQVNTHAVNAYNLGLVNGKQKVLLERLQSDAVEFAKRRRWSEATDARNGVLTALENMTGLATLYDFRRLIPYQDERVAKFLNNVGVKEALGVEESLAFDGCSDAVGKALHNDVMKRRRGLLMCRPYLLTLTGRLIPMPFPYPLSFVQKENGLLLMVFLILCLQFTLLKNVVPIWMCCILLGLLKNVVLRVTISSSDSTERVSIMTVLKFIKFKINDLHVGSSLSSFTGSKQAFMHELHKITESEHVVITKAEKNLQVIQSMLEELSSDDVVFPTA